MVAQTTRWNGSQSTDWFDAGNWDNGVPGPGHEARIGWISSGNPWPVIDGDVNIRRLFMQSNNNQLTVLSGSTLNIAEDVSISNTSTLNAGHVNMTIGTNFSSQGTVAWETGEIEVGGNFTTSGNSTSFNFGNADVSVGGNFTTTGISTFGTGTLEVEGSFSIGNAQTFQLQGGSIIVNSASTLRGNLDIDQGGTFTINAPFTVSGSPNLNLIDGHIIINGDYSMTSGTFVIEEGSLSIFGDTSISGDGVIDAGSASLLFDGELSMLSGVLNLEQADLIISGNSSFSGNGVFNMGSGNIVFEGDIELRGNPTFNPELSTATLLGTSGIAVFNNIDGNTIFFHDLVVAEGANIISNANVFVINDMVVEEGGYFDVVDGRTINIVGNVTGYPDVDTNRPYIIFLNIIDDTTIKAIFNEALTQATAENTANFRIDDAVFNGTQIGTISSAELGGVSNNEVTLTLNLTTASGIIEQGVEYVLVANNIQSTSGSLISTNHRKRFGYPDFSTLLLRYYPGGLDRSHLQLWLDAADPRFLFSGIDLANTAGDGDPVAVWVDKSGNNHNAIQTLAANRPVLYHSIAMGERPSLFFDNSEYLLFDGSFVESSDYNITALVARSSTKSYNAYLGGSGSGANNNLHIFWASNTRLNHHHWGNDYNVTVPAFTGSLAGEVHVMNFRQSGEPNRRLWRNGEFLGSRNDARAIISWQGSSIGRYMDANNPNFNNKFHGYVSELIMHNKVLSETERIIIENYYAAKWSQTLHATANKFDAPMGYGHQLAGIGRESASDFVLTTVYTSGGLGFISESNGFLAANDNYVLAAHNNMTDVDSNIFFSNNYILEKWNRTWYVQKTQPGSDGMLTLYFDFDDYDLPPPDTNNSYTLLHNPWDPEFAPATTTLPDASVSFSGSKVLFHLSSNDLANGFYTIGNVLAEAVADPGQTTITAIPFVIEANGMAQSIILVEAKYFTGDNLPFGGDDVSLSTTAGSLSHVTDNGDGTYMAVLTASASVETAVVSGTLNGEVILDTATVDFVIGAPDQGLSNIWADPVSIIADGISTAMITVQARDYLGNSLSVGGALVTLNSTSGAISQVTDNGNGTYTAFLTSETTVQSAVIMGTINNAAINSHAVVNFVAGPADGSQSDIFVYPSKISADGVSSSLIIVQARDSNNNLLTFGGDNVVINTTAGTLSDVEDNNNGTYTAMLTSSETVETAIVTAAINGSPLNTSAVVEFVDYIVLNYYPGGLDNSHLQAWWDAADPEFLFTDPEGTIQANAGDRIGMWKDKSMFSHHATQSTFALRPLLDVHNGFGGRPSLWFNNAEFLLFDGSFVINTNYNVNVVVTRTSGREYNVYLGGVASVQNGNLHLFWGANNRLNYHHYLNDLNAMVPAFDSNQEGELHTFRFSGVDESPARQMWRNGYFQQQLTSTAPLIGWEGSAIGRYMPRGGEYYEGRLAEIIMHDRQLNNTERIIIENYAATKWGHPLNPSATFYDAPVSHSKQLVGIGCYSASDRVTETVFTSGGMGFRAPLPGLLNGVNNFIMAAHNNLGGYASEALVVNDEYLQRWKRSWYLQKYVPNGDGNMTVYFNCFDYLQSYPESDDAYFLLYHPDNPSFPDSETIIIDAEAVVNGVEVSFKLNSLLLENGYYTLGRIAAGVIFYSRTNGLWPDGNIWSLTSHQGPPAGLAPSADDQAIIDAAHTVTLSGNVILDKGSIIVNGTLITNQHAIEGGGSFILEAGGTLHVGAADGINVSGNTGNVRNLNKSFSTQANYVYDGSAPQHTGNALPGTVNSLRIDNPNGVTAHRSLTVNGLLELDNGIFSMPPGTSLVANNVDKTNGNIRMQLTIDGEKGWRMIASPVATTYDDLLNGFVSQGFTGAGFPGKQPNLLWFDEQEVGTTNMAWRTPGNISDNIAGGRGHFIYMFNGAEMSENGQGTGNFYDDVLPVTMDVTGLEYATGGSIFDFGVTHTPRSESNITDTDIPEMNTGWNLVGNPSTASLNWDEPSGWTRTHIDDAFYVWDPGANNGNGDFRLWNGTTGTLDNGLIAPFQAFWVRANDINPAMTMNDAAKTTGGQYVGGGFETKNQPYYVPTALKLKLEADGMETWTVLAFCMDAKMGEDPGDAYRLEPMNENWLQMYTTTSEHHLPMIINNLPAYFDDPLVIPVYLKGQRGNVPVAGKHLLSWTLPENWPMHWDIVLMDHTLKTALPMDGKVQALEFMVNHSNKSSVTQSTANNPLAMPANIVTGGSAPRQRLSSIHGSAGSDDVVEPRTTNVKIAPTFSIVIYPGSIPDEMEYMAPQASLMPVFPNPVSDIATIKFSLPEADNVRIDVYDLYGRRMERITNQWFGTGIHALHYARRSCAPGIYFVVMTSSDIRMTRKMILK